MKKKCNGITFFLKFDMLGNQVRKCDTCSSIYTVGKSNANWSCKRLMAVSPVQDK